MILFSSTDMYTALSSKLRMLSQEIEGYDRNYILNTDIEKTVEYLWQKYRLEAPMIHFDQKAIVFHEDAPNGVHVTVSFPYAGSQEALTIQPTTDVGGSPDAYIGDGDFQVIYTGSERTFILDKIDRDCRTIAITLRNAANDLSKLDSELQEKASIALQQKIQKLQNNVVLVEALGIPVLRREESPPIYPALELRRKLPISPPPIPNKPDFIFANFGVGSFSTATGVYAQNSVSRTTGCSPCPTLSTGLPTARVPDGPLTRYSWPDSIRSNLSEPLMMPSLSCFVR